MSADVPTDTADTADRTLKILGASTTQLYFMPDVEVTCGACKGARFDGETLEVTGLARGG